MSAWPEYSPDEMEAVQRVLASGQVNYWQGGEGRAFERELAAYCGAPYALAVANGTLALDLALHALGIGEGDEVVVTPRTFIASASSIARCGARPVFADVDPDSQNITPETVRPLVTERTQAILAVHLAGWPCDMPGLGALAAAHGLKLIEDAAQAHGATFQGQPVGSFGDAAAFSFCTDKILSTGGEGGMLLLRDETAWRRAWAYRDHGKDWTTVHQGDHPPGYRWVHTGPGTNARLTEMQAAIGRVQLGKLGNWLERRRANAAALAAACRESPALRVPEPPAHIGHAYYRFYCFVRPERLRRGWDRDAVAAALQARGAPVRQGICPEVYRERALADAGLVPPEPLATARALGETSLALPVHPTLEESELADFCAAIRAVMKEAGR